ncbi:MAG: branched-chain amino acid ABC transporter permease, partial [Comamonas sp.]
SMTFALGVALAGVAGVLFAPLRGAQPFVGPEILGVAFVVVVIGGMGSIIGSIITGFGLGVVEGLTKLIYPDAAGVVIFIVMIITLAIRPNGLFGQEAR